MRVSHPRTPGPGPRSLCLSPSIWTLHGLTVLHRKVISASLTSPNDHNKFLI